MNPDINDYVIWPPNYYVAPATQSAVPIVSTTGASGQLVYDATGKPVGVLLQNQDRSEEYVPLRQ